MYLSTYTQAYVTGTVLTPPLLPTGHRPTRRLGAYIRCVRQMVGFTRASRVSRVTIRISVMIRVRFSFIGAILCIAVAWPHGLI